MNKKRIVFALVSQNHAGKSGNAIGLTDIGLLHYSVRETIRKIHLEKRLYPIQNDRAVFQDFAEAQKHEYGPQVFLERIIAEFLATDVEGCVIESLRTPGEAQWITSLHERIENCHGRVIGIVAPDADRFQRFLKGRKDEIATTNTREEFDHHEWLVNKGTLEWEENVLETIQHASKIFENPDGKLTETVKAIQSYYFTVRKTIEILNDVR